MFAWLIKKAKNRLIKVLKATLPNEPILPLFIEISPICDELFQPLFIIKEFTNSGEGDLYKAYKDAIEHISMIDDSKVASYFKTYLVVSL